MFDIFIFTIFLFQHIHFLHYSVNIMNRLQNWMLFSEYYSLISSPKRLVRFSFSLLIGLDQFNRFIRLNWVRSVSSAAAGDAKRLQLSSFKFDCRQLKMAIALLGLERIVSNGQLEIESLELKVWNRKFRMENWESKVWKVSKSIFRNHFRLLLLLFRF